jgi:hypothetical protein
LLNTILLEEHEISKVCLALIIKLFNSTRSFIYIPGKTLEEEKQRLVMLQHGILPIFIHILFTTKYEVLKDIIKKHIKENYGYQDIEYTSKLLDNHLRITYKEAIRSGKVMKRNNFGFNNKEVKLDKSFTQFEKRLKLANQVQRTTERNTTLILPK